MGRAAPGLAPRIGLSFGQTVNLVGLAVLLLWWPLRQRPGLGTVLNIVVIGTVTDIALAWMPAPEAHAPRIALLGFGILLNGIAGGAYIGAGLGPGPRDGLMTGLCQRVEAADQDRAHGDRTGGAWRWLDAGRHGRFWNDPVRDQHRLGGASRLAILHDRQAAWKPFASAKLDGELRKSGMVASGALTFLGSPTIPGFAFGNRMSAASPVSTGHPAQQIIHSLGQSTAMRVHHVETR